MNRRLYFLLIFSLILIIGLLPHHARASIIVSEIMYDPQGTDTDHEWVELYNTGSDTVEITKDWRFVVGGDNHTLVSYQGGESIPAGGYAIVVNKPEVFLSDYAAFSGIIFDSSFSLNNTGTILSLKNGDIAENSTSYSSDAGASGDGNSLNWVDGAWKPAAPTPGSAAADVAAEDSSSENSSPSFSSSSSGTSVVVPVPKEPALSIKMNAPQVTVAGAHTQFSVITNGNDSAISRCSFSWNFGDGDVRREKEVYREYAFIGDYIIVLDASCGEKQFTLRQKIKVITPDIGITALAAGGIEIANRTPYELNLSGWYLRGGNSFFALPKNTFVIAHTKIAFANSVTKLPVGEVALLYPDGLNVVSDSSLAAPAYAAVPVTNTYVHDDSYVSAENVPDENNLSEEVTESANSIASTSLITASVQDSVEGVDRGFWSHYGWVLGLTGVIILALGAFFVGARSFHLGERKNNIVDEITFVE